MAPIHSSLKTLCISSRSSNTPSRFFLMASSQSLTQSHPAVKLLVKKLKDGSLTGQEKPAVVHASDPVFVKTNLNNFRSCYKNTRKKLGLFPMSRCKLPNIAQSNFTLTIYAALIDDEANLNRKCTDDEESPATKKRKLYTSSDEEDGGSDVGSLADATVDASGFKPMVGFSTRFEPRTTNRRLTVLIVLPTGVDVNDFSVHVVNDGNHLDFKCLWPKEVINVETLHRKWLLSEQLDEKIENYHPKLLGFETFFKGLRKRASDPVQSSCRIALPFTVETHIYKKSNLQWRNSTTRVSYIELRAEAEEYGVDNNEAEEFEVV